MSVLDHCCSGDFCYCGDLHRRPSGGKKEVERDKEI